MQHPKTNSEAGFTLVEVLIVALILMILLAMAVPRFVNTYDRIRLDTTADKLVSLIQYLQERAMIESRQFRLVLVAEEANVQIEFKENNKIQNDEFRPLLENLNQRILIPTGLSLSSPFKTFTFLPDGQTSNRYFDIKDKNANAIRVFQSGKKDNLAAISF